MLEIELTGQRDHTPTSEVAETATKLATEKTIICGHGVSQMSSTGGKQLIQ